MDLYYNQVKAKLKRKEQVSAAWLHMASRLSDNIVYVSGSKRDGNSSVCQGAVE